MPRVAQQADGFQRAEDLFNPFPFLLTDGIARLASGAPINGTGQSGRVLGHMWVTRS
jgi:hypothetical protein